MIRVADLLRPVRRPRPEGIEELAAAIAAGRPPSAVEIDAVLTAARCSDEDLQAAVDRHGRVIDLRRRIADAAPAVKRFKVLDAEVQAAADKAARAREEHEAVLARVRDEHYDCRLRTDDADRATEQLLAPANLPPIDAERLREAEAASDAASTAADEARRAVDAAARSLRQAEEASVKATEDATVARGNADIQADAERWRQAVKTRGEKLRDAEAVLRTAAAAAADTARKVADIRAAIRKAILG
jgi:hypothetical protein